MTLSMGLMVLLYTDWSVTFIIIMFAFSEIKETISRVVQGPE